MKPRNKGQTLKRKSQVEPAWDAKNAKRQQTRKSSDIVEEAALEGSGVTRVRQPIHNDNEDETCSSPVAEALAPSETEFTKGDDPVQRLPVPPKTTVPDLIHASDLRSRLSSFLPELHKANAELQSPGIDLERRLDKVDDDEEQYIEMELGLGVLQEKNSDPARPGELKVTASDDSESEAASLSDPVEARGESDKIQPSRSAMSRLLGAKTSPRKNPTIQEICDH